MMYEVRRMLTAAAVTLGTAGAAQASCGPVAEPVLDLAFASRYAQDDATRSEINPEREQAAEAALEPLDAFVSDMTERTDTAMEKDDQAAMACVLAELAHWARADALSDLGTQTVQLTIGSRLAALALVAGQVSFAGDPADAALVANWLARRMTAQMTFWETAPDGAAQGNLRAWAAFAGAAVALITDDPVMRGWAAWSLSYVACTAAADGSLPQEMGRGRLALHYQVHAVGPLTVGAALLEQQGLSVASACGGALDRIVAFTLADLAAGGAQSAALSGAPQSLSTGMAGMKDFQLAWAEAWLRLRRDDTLDTLLAPRRPLKYSKLGGDQTRIWRAPQ